MSRINWRAGLVAGLFVSLCCASFSRADEPKPADAQTLEAKVVKHLNAGEFSVARQMIGGIADPAMRDAMMGRMAQAQLRGGNRRGFANALGGMGDNGMMGGMLNSMAGNPQSMFGNPGFGIPGMGMPGNAGGAAFADFEPLMELIRTTTGVPKPGWVDDGGVGTVREFPGGVFVDAKGQMKRIVTDGSTSLAAVRQTSLVASSNRDAFKSSTMRKVSLTRLERHLMLKRALGQEPDVAASVLAGLQKIKYVLVYPETGDIVVAGPAGAWGPDAENRLVSVDSGRPTLRLDDLVVLLRNAQNEDARFGCSIDPRPENLAETKSFLEASAKQPLKPGNAAREQWLKKLRDTVGKQDVSVFGIDPRTRVAHVLVEADYRMKLIGMGLEEGVLGVTSYLDSAASRDASLPMDVLRWWFTVNYDAVQATEARDGFELKGQGVKVLSENQMLAERGKRVATGAADEVNAEFAASFTKHFPQLAAKYPIYAELQNMFDLALVAALVRTQDLANQTRWSMTYLGDVNQFPVALGVAPKEVDSIINHKLVNRTRIVAGVSGGVSVDLGSLAKTVKTDTYGQLTAERNGSAPKKLPADMWWWD